MAPHSSTLAWKIPWTEEPGRLQSMGSLRVGHDWATSLSLFTFMHWRRKWQPTPVFLSGESQGWGAWWAAVYGVAQSRTRLSDLAYMCTFKRISFFSSCMHLVLGWLGKKTSKRVCVCPIINVYVMQKHIWNQLYSHTLKYMCRENKKQMWQNIKNRYLRVRLHGGLFVILSCVIAIIRK